MDQVKKYFAIAMKHGFWIGTGTIFIGSLLVWWMSTSSLNAELESRTSKINSSVSQVSQTRGEVPTAPNPTSHAEMERLIKKRTDEVVDAWTRMYDRQRPILTWPREELKEDFVAEFEHKIPIEEYVAHPTLEQDEVDPSIRTRYRDYIDRILPGLAEIAKSKWTASFDAVAVFKEMNEGGMMKRPDVDVSGIDDEIPLVYWGSGSQSSVLADLFPWRGRGERPSTLEVYYSQENIWILKQLLQIVADVNGDAELPFQAKIREIKQLAIGSSADFTAGEILKPGESFVGGGFGGEEEYGDEGDYEDDEGGDEDYGDDEGFDGVYGESSDPGDNRYVNTQLEPITGAQLRIALESNSPEDANIAVAKRVPVMMSFQMDQRSVPDLVSACGSAELMVEVRQVRILPDAGAGFSPGSTGFSDGGGDEDEDDYSDEGEGDGGGSYMPMSVAVTPQKEFPYDMEVQIYGLIYIYNPPQASKLGVDQVDENTVIDGVSVSESDGSQDPLPAPSQTPPAIETPSEATTDPQPAPVAAPPTALSTP